MTDLMCDHYLPSVHFVCERKGERERNPNKFAVYNAIISRTDDVTARQLSKWINTSTCRSHTKLIKSPITAMMRCGFQHSVTLFLDRINYKLQFTYVLTTSRSDDHCLRLSRNVLCTMSVLYLTFHSLIAVGHDIHLRCKPTTCFAQDTLLTSQSSSKNDRSTDRRIMTSQSER